MLTLKNLSASIESKSILKNISLAFETGKVYVLIGPNGSGKSTLASAILGRPDIELTEDSEMFWGDTSILDLSPDKRAKLGIFGTLQSPPPLSGISVFRFLRAALPDRNALELETTIKAYAHELDIADEFLRRGLHDGFSGGEKKKFETLLFGVLNPRLALFDELDTGVDVDAQKTIGNFLKQHKTPDQTFVFITHSTKIFDFLPPDETIILKGGVIAEHGDGSLARNIIETEGFKQ